MSKRSTLWIRGALACAVLPLVLSGVPAGQRFQEPAEVELDPRDVAGRVKVPLREAIAAARLVQSGTVCEAWLEGEVVGGETEVSYQVVIVEDRTLHEVELDAVTGRVLDVEAQDAGHYLSQLRAFQAGLRSAERDLDDLIASAQEVVKGIAVGAGLKVENGEPGGEVVFANSRYLIEAEVDARSGHLVKLELVDSSWIGDEDEEDDDDDDDDEEGEREAGGAGEEGGE